MLRRARAIGITALLWALVWTPIGAVVALSRGSRNDFVNLVPVSAAVGAKAVTSYALEWGLLGAINGALFALVLSFAERKRSVATLTIRRIALWGAIATVSLPVLLLSVLILAFPSTNPRVEVVPLLLIVSLGAACGTGMLVVAQRGHGPDDSAA